MRSAVFVWVMLITSSAAADPVEIGARRLTAVDLDGEWTYDNGISASAIVPMQSRRGVSLHAEFLYRRTQWSAAPAEKASTAMTSHHGSIGVRMTVPMGRSGLRFLTGWHSGSFIDRVAGGGTQRGWTLIDMEVGVDAAIGTRIRAGAVGGLGLDYETGVDGDPIDAVAFGAVTLSVSL